MGSVLKCNMPLNFLGYFSACTPMKNSRAPELDLPMCGGLSLATVDAPGPMPNRTKEPLFIFRCQKRIRFRNNELSQTHIVGRGPIEGCRTDAGRAHRK